MNLYRYAGDEPLNATDPLGTTENPLETVPRGDGGQMRELDKEERDEPPGGGNPGQPTNLAAPKGSGGWKKVGCEAAMVIPGKAGLGVAGVCGLEAPPIGHIPSLPELGEKAVGLGEEIINLL